MRSTAAVMVGILMAASAAVQGGEGSSVRPRDEYPGAKAASAAEERRVARPACDWRTVQEALKKEGFYEAEVDGINGSRTRKALENFQEKHDLDDSGEMDQATATKLGTGHACVD